MSAGYVRIPIEVLNDVVRAAEPWESPDRVTDADWDNLMEAVFNLVEKAENE